jgi:hypothetical protein
MKKAIFAAALLMSASPALAGWEYTKWGMTPKQVVAASKGKAKLGNGEPGDRVVNEQVGALGTYHATGGEFGTIFYFREGKLNQVNLKMTGDDREKRCDALSADLNAKYGAPDSSSIEGVTSWKDYRGKNIVRLIHFGDMCNIHYEQSGAHNLSL